MEIILKDIKLKNEQDILIEQLKSYRTEKKDEYTILCERLYELVMAKR